MYKHQTLFLRHTGMRQLEDCDEDKMKKQNKKIFQSIYN